MSELIEDRIDKLKMLKSEIMVSVLADEGLPAPLIFILDKHISSSISYIEQDFDYLKSSEEACLIPENFADYDRSVALILGIRTDFPPLVKVKISTYLKNYDSIVNRLTMFDKQGGGFSSDKISVS